MRVLLVDDSETLRMALVKGLGASGFVLDAVADGQQGWVYATRNDYDVMILDLMLPKLDGLSLLRRLREHGSTMHVLVLTARSSVHERIEGLAAGADDYLTKPFDFGELVARLQALGRRRYARKDPVLHLGRLALDTVRHEVRFDEKLLALTPREYALLRVMVLRAGTVVSRETLEDHLYNELTLPSSNAVESAMSALRTKLRAAGAPDLIATRRGQGYLIESETP
ncbi:MAG TPA: response regulator transcription factor [Planctomycetota bacterium]|nr:response regulator transcription factor [Planctomycetota bacterium]